MSIKASLSSDGLEEVYTPPTLKEMCLYKCLTNKEILTKEVEVDEDMDGSEKLDLEKFRLKEPVQRDLVEALVDVGKKYLFMLTPKYEPVLAAIRMSQPEHLVKVHVNNTHTLEDRQLELLISGGHVKSLDIHQCLSLGGGSLDAINKFGSKLEYLRIGDSSRILPHPKWWNESSAILKTPNLKTFIVSDLRSGWTRANVTNYLSYWRFLLHDFINKLEDLQISNSGRFQTLEFLEPARTKLSALAFRNCDNAKDANAWASLFKLDKLRSLEVVGSSIGKALEGENVAQRLLDSMPYLSRLVIDPGLAKAIAVNSSIRGQRPLAKRLEFLGVLDNDDEDAVRKAKTLANEVAYFGTVEGEMRVLKYYSNRLNHDCLDSTLEGLLERLNEVSTSPYKTVAVVALLTKIFKNNGIDVTDTEVFFQCLTPLFTRAIWRKLGEVLQDQCVGAILCSMSSGLYGKHSKAEPEFIRGAIDVIMKLDGELHFDHYATLVPVVMRNAEIAMIQWNLVLHEIGMEDFQSLLKKIAQLLENAVDCFPEEINEFWGIASVLVVIKELKDMMVSHESERIHCMIIFSSLIASLRKLCINSGPRRAAFHSAKGVPIIMELLQEVIDGCLGLGVRDSFALLEILQIVTEDRKLDLSESEIITITAGLEKLLISVYSQCECWKSKGTTHYFELESMCGLLNFLESDPKYDYEASDAVKKIMADLK